MNAYPFLSGMRACGLWLLYLVVAGPLLAQPAVFDVRGVPLGEALRLAGQRGGFSLTYDPPLVAGRVSRCITRETGAPALLTCVLEGSGLVFAQLPSGPYALAIRPSQPARLARLRGRVMDADTGLPLPDASIVVSAASRGTVAGNEGSFVIDGLAEGLSWVRASYVGYAQAQALVRLSRDSTSFVTLSLQRAPVVIAPVIVEGLRFRDPLLVARMSNPTSETPSAAPEEVAARLVGMTGIHPGRVVADLHLQGGEAGEHLMTLDGAPVYTPPIIAGLVGPFSPFAIGRITVQKAGYGALSVSSTVGVIEAEHTFPVEEGRRVDVQADALALHARVASGGERPDGLRVQMMVAGRLGRDAAQTLPSLHDLLRDWNRPDPFLAAVTSLPRDLAPQNDPVEPLLQPIKADVPRLSFQDLHVAMQALHPAGRRLTASAYVGSRQLVADVPNLGRLAVLTLRDQYTWYSTVGQVRYDAVQSSRLRTSVQARASLYRLTHQFVLPDSLFARRELPEDDGNTFSEASAHAQAAYHPSPTLSIEAGIVPTLTASRYSVLGLRRDPIRHRSNRFQFPTYAGLRWTVGPRMEVEAGLRATFLGGLPFLEPRAALRYDLPTTALGALALRVGAGIYRQFVQPFEVSSISPSSILSATRVWLVVDRTRPTPVAQHYSLEAALMPARGWNVSLESYYRRQRRTLQVDFSADSLSSRNADQRAFLLVGDGYASGLAGQVMRARGSSEVKARYEFSFVERQDGLFSDASYPVAWNEPHRVEVAVATQPWPRVALSARWTSSWGRTWAFRRAYYDYVGANTAFQDLIPEALQGFVERQVKAYGLQNPAEQRLPPMHRLDLGAAYAQPVGAVKLQVRLDFLNALDGLQQFGLPLGLNNVDEYRLEGNPGYYATTRDASGFGLLEKKPRPALPFTAILALRMTW